MIFGLTTFTLIHVVLSLLGIVAGLVVAGGLVAGKRLDGWTGVFLTTTVLTNITGFGFPFVTFLPSHAVAIISLVVLPVVIAARYWKHLMGLWRKVYVVGTLFALYLNVFVLAGGAAVPPDPRADRPRPEAKRAALRADAAPRAGAVRLARPCRAAGVPQRADRTSVRRRVFATRLLILERRRSVRE